MTQNVEFLGLGLFKHQVSGIQTTSNHLNIHIRYKISHLFFVPHVVDCWDPSFDMGLVAESWESSGP